MEYPKIQTIFKRDDKGLIIPTEFTRPEFEWLKNCKFRAEEKIDGTNIRVEIDLNEEENDWCFAFAGRTNKSIIPDHLLAKLNEIFTAPKLRAVFDKLVDIHITLYGEGFGHKIQTPGNRYNKSDVDFILFDVNMGGIWLKREAVEDIANKLNIKVVPVLGHMTIMEAVKFVDDGFKSLVAEDKELDAEGLVLKTPHNLLMKDGERIALKVKSKDFKQFRAAYGDDAIIYTHIGNSLVLSTNVEQPVNQFANYETT